MLMLITFLLLALSAVLTGMLGVRLAGSIRRYHSTAENPIPEDAPSISVCIPARNEVHAMTRCLERVLASDYNKLEVVVFDDSSDDNTSIIIRSFAQAGVRFVSGTAVPDGWLGKNYALEVLAREASGTYVVFMDVDTSISPHTISRLVSYMTEEDAEMLSVIPERADGWRMSVLFGYLRYFWELTLRGKQGVAASSALWVIDRHVFLKEMGGLLPLKSTAAPESAVAAALGAKKYRCLISDAYLDVAYEKKWTSQMEAGRRLLYPKAGGTLTGATIAAACLMLLNVPFVVLLSGFIAQWDTVRLTAAVVSVFGMTVYGLYTKHLWRQGWWAGALLWPIIVLQELMLLFSSLVGYWRHTITWKGRPVSPSPVPNKLNS